MSENKSHHHTKDLNNGKVINKSDSDSPTKDAASLSEEFKNKAKKD